MRGCVTLFLLLGLAAVCGYSIRQIRLLRQDVRELQERVLAGERADRESMLEHARRALDALGRGELEVAEDELDRLDELIDEGQTVAAEERDRLARRLASARAAIKEHSTTATEFVRDLVDDLSRLRDRDEGGEGREQAAEPASD
jgi:multidrug resistance efflux pump